MYMSIQKLNLQHVNNPFTIQEFHYFIKTVTPIGFKLPNLLKNNLMTDFTKCSNKEI